MQISNKLAYFVIDNLVIDSTFVLEVILKVLLNKLLFFFALIRDGFSIAFLIIQ